MQALLPRAVEALRSHGISRAVLFGSQVNGRAEAHSDIDLAIWPAAGSSAHDYFELVDELDALDTLRQWDLVDMTRCSEESTIAKEVAEHGVELFA
ncbi:nucleotidyltransferase domain-containing protein [Olsenella sp. KH3B4]|uniref:nucleotidyltransferase family protein n=1 Tax=Olsenella sp. KH3B4 TaxID=1855394 RepID=UPI0015A62D95|nr:nucleotidyltransferase domain-containing protein [Olsenella sp. KH3B4]